MLVCKAYNGRVVTQWLAETISTISDQDHPNHNDDRIAPVAMCMRLDCKLKTGCCLVEIS